VDITTKFAVACLTAGCGFGFAASEGFAHGSMEQPISRIYKCFKEGPEAPKTDACKALVEAGGTQPLYDWMEVNQGAANGKHKKVVPDGTLCAGGRDKYVGLDLPRKDWRKTTIVPNAKGKYKAVFYATTPHATKYFRIYITKDGWDRGKPLNWKDIRKIKTKRSVEAKDNRYKLGFKVPKGTEGRHVIYAVWQRSDSQEAFYSCSDVKVVWNSAEMAESDALQWNEVGDAIAHNSLSAGSTVTFRVFDKDGGDAERHTVTVNRTTGEADNWPAALAREVNSQSAVFRIGVLDDTGDGLSIAPVKEAAGNLVYRSTSYPGFTYHIDIDSPPTH
jgi:chitin-binding protein